MKSDVDGEKESESEDIVKVIEFPEKIEIKKERKKKFTENVIDRVELPIVSTQPEINYWKNAKTAFDAKSALQQRYDDRHRRRHEERKKVLKNRVAPASNKPQRSFYFRGIHFNLTNALANARKVDGTKLFECNDRWCYWCWLDIICFPVASYKLGKLLRSSLPFFRFICVGFAALLLGILWIISEVLYPSQLIRYIALAGACCFLMQRCLLRRSYNEQLGHFCCLWLEKEENFRKELDTDCIAVVYDIIIALICCPFCATAQAAVHMEMNSYYVSPVDTENDQLKLPIQGLLELLSQTSKSPLPMESTELAHRASPIPTISRVLDELQKKREEEFRNRHHLV